MIDSQLRTSGVNAEPVLRRMAEVARERFVPEAARGFAYIDRAIALGGGRQLAAPVVQGMMLQEARPAPRDKALLVDGGSGYLAELLRPMVGSLEVLTPAEAVAASRKGGDFTLLVIDGAVEQLPDALSRRLADGAPRRRGRGRERHHPPRHRPQGGRHARAAAAGRTRHSRAARIRRAEGLELLR